MSKPISQPAGAVEDETIFEGDSSPRRDGLEPPTHAEKKSARLKVAEMIEEAVERRFQSAKDKRWAELEKQYGSLSELVEQISTQPETTGASAEQDTKPAAEAAEDEMLAEPDGDAPVDLVESLAERVQALAKLPALRENEDARSILLRHANPRGMEDYAALLEDLLRLGGGLRPAEAGRPSTPASVVIPGGSDAPADLRQAYERRKRSLRPGDINALTALKREYRQKGLDVF